MNLKRTALYPCSYLKNKVAKAEIIETTSKRSEKNFTQLMKNGYRRSGKYTYKPICENCSSCIPIRISVNDFQPNKTQKRTLKRGEKLLTSVKKSLIFNEHEFFLFSKYQQIKHAVTFNEYDVENTYKNFLLKSCIETELVTFFDTEQKTKIVSVVDPLCDGLSAVYTFYDPSDKKNSFGTYAILWQIEECKRRNKKFLYLGYLVQECSNMVYKKNFKPYDIFINNKWTRVYD